MSFKKNLIIFVTSWPVFWFIFPQSINYIYILFLLFISLLSFINNFPKIRKDKIYIFISFFFFLILRNYFGLENSLFSTIELYLRFFIFIPFTFALNYLFFNYSNESGRKILYHSVLIIYFLITLFTFFTAIFGNAYFTNPDLLYQLEFTDRAYGFTGSPSMSSSYTVVCFFLLIRLRKFNKIFINKISLEKFHDLLLLISTFFSLFLLKSGVGFLILFFGLIIKICNRINFNIREILFLKIEVKKLKFILLLLSSIIFIILISWLFVAKLNIEYFIQLYELKTEQILIFNDPDLIIEGLSNINFSFRNLMIGVSDFEYGFGSDFAWALALFYLGIFGIIIYFFHIYQCLKLIGNYKYNISPIFLMVLATFHYSTLFIPPGQMILAISIISSRFIETK